MLRKGCAWILFAVALPLVFCGSAFAAKDKETLVVADQYDATAMDPIGNSDLPSARACQMLYDTLVFLDSNGGISPGLAEKWEFLSGTEYKFWLRKGVKFHNGEEMKADDVKFSLERATGDAGVKIRTYSQVVDHVEVLDDYTCIVHLKNVDYSFFTSLGNTWASIVSRSAVESAGDNFGMNPVGTGPLKFVSWQKGNKYVLERFDDYWGEKEKYKRLEVRSVPEPTSRTIELESGGADIAFPIIPGDLKRIDENENLVLYREPQTSVGYMGFNTTKKPFDDVRVRRALHAALDVTGIQKAVWRGMGKVPRSLVPGSIRYSIESEIPPHAQNIDLAKKLLDEAGVKDLKLEIWTNERKERIDTAIIVQAQFQEIGVSAEIRVLEWGAYLNGLREKKHDLFILGWPTLVPDPNFALAMLLDSGSASNYTFYSNPKMEELLAKGRSLPDGDERAAVYREIQLFVNEELPMIYMYNDESTAGAQKSVKGFKPSPNENHSFRGVWIEE